MPDIDLRTIAADEGWSQAAVRTAAVFTDNHGRKWGAVVEKSTGAPCSVPQLLMGPDQSDPPLRVPVAFMAHWDAYHRTFRIDYDAWLAHLRSAHDSYRQRALEVSLSLFKVVGLEMLEREDPALMELIGIPPEPLEQVMAAKAGNKWVLGINRADGKPFPKPEWADEFFPEPIPTQLERMEAMAFPDVEDESAEPEPSGLPEAYPHQVGKGLWFIDEAHALRCMAGTAAPFPGTRKDAEEALDVEEATAPAGG